MAGRDNGQTLSQNVNGRTLEHDDIYLHSMAMAKLLAITSVAEHKSKCMFVSLLLGNFQHHQKVIKLQKTLLEVN